MIAVVPSSGFEDWFDSFAKRRSLEDPSVRQRVSEILADVRLRGDKAVLDWSRRLDGASLENTRLRVAASELRLAGRRKHGDLFEALERAASNIRRFHQRQKQRTFRTSVRGVILGQRVDPLRRVGLYVPGGKAAYPSSILMNAIPAQVAGVREIAVASPPGSFQNPGVLAALEVLGLKECYRMGGAQAIGALAYGTAGVPAVDKIVGPGNAFVAEAKRQVFGTVGVDLIAGPTEIVIWADKNARVDFVAADLLAQAEHDEQAAAICVTTSARLASDLQRSLERQIRTLGRRAIIEASLKRFGAVLLARSRGEAIAWINRIAPEHLELMTSEADPWKSDLRAGAIFVGPYTPEPIGDYFAGPNHVLPTGGTARFASPLGVSDFQKKTSVLRYSRKRLLEDARWVEILAAAEGLDAHARAVTIRGVRGQGSGNRGQASAVRGQGRGRAR
ncbi:MAG: histidinol dehydrogenase [Acidobacteriota bacterium]